MNPVRRRRLLWVFFLVVSLAGAMALVLYALRQNLHVFYSPTQVLAGEVPLGQRFRIGGLVVADSIERDRSDLQVRFVLTDDLHEVTVQYQGILPDLFREGQGIVALGSLNHHGIFLADQVLAKHDADYMPPEVAAAMSGAGRRDAG